MVSLAIPIGILFIYSMVATLKKSLQIKLFLVVIVLPSIIHGVFSVIKIYEDKTTTLREMEVTKQRVLNELVYGLADPLWNFNLDQAKTLARLKLKERDFMGLSIRDLETGTPIFSMVKEGDDIFEVPAVEPDHTWVIPVEIQKNKKSLWQAHCFFTDRFIKEIIYRNIRYSLLLNLMLTSALTLLLIMTLNILVVRPVNKTTEVVRRIADGDFSHRIDVRRQDEIGEIGNEVNNLLDQLELTIREVNLVMEAMAAGDFSKRITVVLSGDLDKLKNHTNRSIEVLSERTIQLKDAQQELIGKAHQAGMADVASGTLHNVGNILNSVKVSAQILRNDLENSSITNFIKANELLRENSNSLEDFLLHSPKGKMLIDYYLKLESVLVEEKESMRSNLVRLNDKVDMIADVILAQQNYAGISSLIEISPLDTIVDDALTLQSGSIERYGIEVVKQINSVPLVPIQKAKLAHILINLIKNAKESMVECPMDNRKLLISIEQIGGFAYLKVKDTGKGIEKSNLKRIFTHGYTTKKKGHGFGLHSCANYMSEMKGKIWAESEGLNKGATFVLEFRLSDNGSCPTTDEIKPNNISFVLSSKKTTAG